jgi:sensor histidine kinase YesM
LGDAIENKTLTPAERKGFMEILDKYKKEMDETSEAEEKQRKKEMEEISEAEAKQRKAEGSTKEE